MSSQETEQEAAPTPRRSKITPERAQELYTAVLDMLRENGYESLTMEGVASRSRCGKSTLYRQWGSKPELVVAALHGTRRGLLPRIDTGTLAGDLREAARVIGVGSGRDTSLMLALSHAALQSPELLCALREALILPEMAAIDAMVKRGVERGEVAADNPAREFVSTQLLGVMRARPMLAGTHADETFLIRFVEGAVLPALGLDASASGS
ncbi:TetR/AcrR family transcriptional regulator [Streptomyces sp. RKAG290]|uniref:TetR/AcrR family transcriptional regulator n=1 Tax=Streptomyces sp. RKAG290 TaxID=2888348 RepID=UPI0020345B54|nr:TetR/AcrR family transcriptional regulator [Streptomyces sp. RKAG290]MCM2410288.1 TetR/AcrR family transcriptional regulator [Streptomyces sp. RKAG290]